MSGLLSFHSAADHLVVIDLALNHFGLRQRHRNENLSMDTNIMLETLWIERLRDELLTLQGKHPDALIGVNMEFMHSCRDNSAFLNFTRELPDSSKIFFYHILPGCDLQTRMQSDLEDSGVHAEFEKESGVLFLARPAGLDGRELTERCERVIRQRLAETVKGINTNLSELNPKEPRDLLASSGVYVDHYVDIKRLFMDPDELFLVVYYMSRWLLTANREYDALIATSKNGAILAALLGKMTGSDVVCCVNIGPQYALSASAVEQIQPGKRYIYVYDFICLGTEAKLLHALVSSRRAFLAGGIGVASYIPLDNPDLRRKHSPLAELSSLVNLISADIPYHIYLSRDAAGEVAWRPQGAPGAPSGMEVTRYGRRPRGRL